MSDKQHHFKISSEVDVDAREIQLLKTHFLEYDIPNKNRHLANEPKNVTGYLVHVFLYLKYGHQVDTRVDFGTEGDAAAEWCDIIKDDWRKYTEGV